MSRKNAYILLKLFNKNVNPTGHILAQAYTLSINEITKEIRQTEHWKAEWLLKPNKFGDSRLNILFINLTENRFNRTGFVGPEVFGLKRFHCILKCINSCVCSQVLVMPPYQKMGHAATMIQTFYNQVTHKDDVMDITGTLAL